MKKICHSGFDGFHWAPTLDVVESLPGRFRVCALAAGGNIALLAEQTVRHRPKWFPRAQKRARASCRVLAAAGVEPLPEILFGPAGMMAVATHAQAEIIISAAVGVVGLPATYAAIERGKTIALANKEVLVAAGEIVMAAVKRHGVAVLPVDSEHNAIHQCLRGGERAK